MQVHPTKCFEKEVDADDSRHLAPLAVLCILTDCGCGDLFSLAWSEKQPFHGLEIYPAKTVVAVTQREPAVDGGAQIAGITIPPINCY